jgi:predicted tellurium resistance membrane protein TerC
MESLLTVNSLLALVALTSLEIVLGIDNIVFVAIVCQKLPPEQRDKARVLGLILAVVTRVMLLFSLSFLMGAREPIFTVGSHPVSFRDIILLAGGGFLIFKSTKEIHHHVADPHGNAAIANGSAKASLRSIIFQILLVDVVFSFDSVITAVGVADQIAIMVIAVMLAIGVMVAFSKHIVRFVEEYPTLKMLALSLFCL